VERRIPEHQARGDRVIGELPAAEAAALCTAQLAVSSFWPPRARSARVADPSHARPAEAVLASLARHQPVPERVMIVAAHPDDETVGAAGLLGLALDPFVVHVTDGAPRDQRLVPASYSGHRGRYAVARRQEALAALAIVGITPKRTRCLGFVDQQAALQLGAVARKLARLIRTFRPVLVVTHPYEGGHPDHDATAFATRAAIGLCGSMRTPTLVEMTSYHARDGGLHSAEFLASPSRTPTHALELDPSEQALKRRMLAEFASQAEVLAVFRSTRELYRIAPAYDFSRPPQAGPTLYELWGWSMTAAHFCELAREAQVETEPVRVAGKAC
jgi:LmbE family N-acetylglucosaminyl deacetylase